MIELAHGLGGRSDLPVPLWMAVYGGAAAVIISFAALGAFWSSPRFTGASAGRELPEALQRLVDARATRAGLRALGILMLAATLATAALGSRSSTSNPAPTWLYVWFWVGLVPASLVLGPIWRAMNPLRSVTAGLARVSGEREHQFASTYPARLGYWPATISLFVFLWLELVYDRSADPTTVFAFVSLYSFVHVLFGRRYGERWYARADGFEVYSTLISHLSPFGRRNDRRLVFRNPFDGLAGLTDEPGLVAVICLLLGSTAFDGLSRTQGWSDLTEGTTGLANMALGTAGLVWSIAFVAVTYWGGTYLAERIATNDLRLHPERTLTGLFAHSLIPIMIGYTVAHYFSLFVFQGQAGYILASDPFGAGWDIFRTTGWAINYTLVSTAAIAMVQLAAIVIGHLGGVVSAHDAAVYVFRGKDKTRGQYSLLAVMVTYTMGGIALLVGP
jgi:hypothetical protein